MPIKSSPRGSHSHPHVNNKVVNNNAAEDEAYGKGSRSNSPEVKGHEKASEEELVTSGTAGTTPFDVPGLHSDGNLDDENHDNGDQQSLTNGDHGDNLEEFQKEMNNENCGEIDNEEVQPNEYEISKNEFHSKTFIEDIEKFVREFKTKEFEKQKDDQPLNELKDLVAKVTSTLSQYKQYSHSSQRHLEDLRNTMETVKRTIQDDIRKNGVKVIPGRISQ